MSGLTLRRLHGTGIVKKFDLESRVKTNLTHRINRNAEYSPEEIEHVSRLDKRLFGDACLLTKDQTEQMRRLCRFSKVEIKQGQEIRSHRRLIGVIIVFLKRLTLPLIQVHLKPVFAGIEEVHYALVETLAQQQVEINRLRKLVPNADK